MAAGADTAGRPSWAARRRLSATFWRRGWLRGTFLLLPPLAWFALLYLTALVVLLVSAFWRVDPFTTELVHDWNLDNFKTVFTEPVYRTIAFRTIGIAAAVTITDAIIAIPFAYFMARLASPRTRAALFVLVLFAAVGELPGARLRLASDPRQG